MDKWSVYVMTSPSGKVYVGATSDLKHRWRASGNGYKGAAAIYGAIQKYGWDNFDRKVVFEGLTKLDAHAKEIELISVYNSTNEQFGYNSQKGGLLNGMNSISKKLLSESLMGHSVSQRSIDLTIERMSVPVICIETKEIFKSIIKASIKYDISYSSISKACLGKAYTAKELHWAYLADYNNGRYMQREIPNHPSGKVVICLDTGERYFNVCEASRKTGISRRAISYACNKVHLKSGGLRWAFENNLETEECFNEYERR